MKASLLNTYEQRMLDNIHQHGCQVTSVFDPEGGSPGFSYSIGLPETVGQPEVLVYGLPSDLAHSMINEILRQCRGGLVLEDWIELEGLLEGFTCIVRAIPPHRIDAEHFNSAMWYEHHRTGDEMTAAFQIVWPGAGHGLFPWQDGADLDALQPALYEPRPLS